MSSKLCCIVWVVFWNGKAIFSFDYNSIVKFAMCRYFEMNVVLFYDFGNTLFQFCRKISQEIDEILIEERWMKYLNDLYHVIWKDGKLIEPPPDPTEEEKRQIKEEALEKMLDFLPCMNSSSFLISHILITVEYHRAVIGIHFACNCIS